MDHKEKIKNWIVATNDTISKVNTCWRPEQSICLYVCIKKLVSKIVKTQLEKRNDGISVSIELGFCIEDGL